MEQCEKRVEHAVIEEHFETEIFPHWEGSASTNITLGQLVDEGVIDLGEPGWEWDFYDEEQRDRINRKFVARYCDRELGALPVWQFQREFVRLLNEIMPKYKLLYAEIDKGINILQESDEYGKSRDVGSDFPQTQLSGNSDYASRGTDREFETIRNGNSLEMLDRFARSYRDVDVMILDDLAQLFSSLIYPQTPLW